MATVFDREQGLAAGERPVRLENLAGRGLQAVQAAPDGVIEAVEHATLPILGVQWHPERQSFGLRRPDAADAAPIFTYFMEQVR